LDSPADQAGLLPGDLIIAVDDREIENSRQLTTAIGRLEPGVLSQISIIRNGQAIDVPVTLGVRPEDGQFQEQSRRIWPGFSVAQIEDSMRRQLNLSRNDGSLMISAVVQGSRAETAGLQRGDIILSVNGNRSRKDRRTLRGTEQHSFRRSPRQCVPGTAKRHPVQPANRTLTNGCNQPNRR
jgi:serine protease Do